MSVPIMVCLIQLQEILQVHLDPQFWCPECQGGEPGVIAEHHDGPEEVLQPPLPLPCGCPGMCVNTPYLLPVPAQTCCPPPPIGLGTLSLSGISNDPLRPWYVCQPTDALILWYVCFACNLSCPARNNTERRINLEVFNNLVNRQNLMLTFPPKLNPTTVFRTCPRWEVWLPNLCLSFEKNT